MGSAQLRLQETGRWVCEGAHRVGAVSLPMFRVPTGPSGLIPSSLGLLPWHEVGTRPGWASGAVLGVLPAGADFRSWGLRGSLGQGPPCCRGSFSSGTKAAFTAAAKPGVPQTGLGRLILTKGLVLAGGSDALLGFLWLLTSQAPASLEKGN